MVSVYEVELAGGDRRPDHDETKAVGWFAGDELETLEMGEPTRATLATLGLGTSSLEP